MCGTKVDIKDCFCNIRHFPKCGASHAFRWKQDKVSERHYLKCQFVILNRLSAAENIYFNCVLSL